MASHSITGINVTFVVCDYKCLCLHLYSHVCVCVSLCECVSVLNRVTPMCLLGFLPTEELIRSGSVSSTQLYLNDRNIDVRITTYTVVSIHWDRYFQVMNPVLLYFCCLLVSCCGHQRFWQVWPRRTQLCSWHQCSLSLSLSVTLCCCCCLCFSFSLFLSLSFQQTIFCYFGYCPIREK